MKILAFAQTKRELDWFRGKAESGDARSEWYIVRMGDVALGPFTRSKQGPKEIPVSDLGIPFETLWEDSVHLRDELWTDLSTDVRQNLHAFVQNTISGLLLHSTYLRTVVTAAIEEFHPDTIMTPPALASLLIRHTPLSFAPFQSVVAAAARECGISVKAHLSFRVWKAFRTPLALVGIAAGYCQAAFYDGYRVVAWGKCRLSSLFAVGGKKGQAHLHRMTQEGGGGQGGIVFANADTDLGRQFDPTRLPQHVRSRCVAWTGVGRRTRFLPPKWEQQPLDAVIDGGREVASATPLRNAAACVFPTSLTALLSQHRTVWLARPSVSKDAAPSAKLQRYLGGSELGWERYRVWRSMVHGASCFCFTIDVLRVLKPSLIVVGDTAEPHRFIALAARHLGVPTMATSHAIDIRSEEFCRLLPLARSHCVFGNHAPHLAEDDFPGVSTERRVFFDAFSAAPPSSQSTGRPATTARRVVVLTSLFSMSGSSLANGLYVNNNEYETELRKLVEHLLRDEAVKITIKSHPLSDAYALYDDLSKDQEGRVLHFREPWRMDLPIPADLVIVFNCLSTVFFPIVQQRIPVIAHWGALTPLGQRVLPITDLAGDSDSEHVVRLAAALLGQPAGQVAEAAMEKSVKTYRRFIGTPAGGLKEALAWALDRQASSNRADLVEQS